MIAEANARPGTRVKLGAGARSKLEESSLASAPTGRDCVSLAMALLISPKDFLHIPQPSLDLRLSALKRFFRYTELKLLKPSKWGILRDFCHFVGAIDDICSNATAEDKFILRVTLPPPVATSLHCVAVRGREICDPATGQGWLPLAPASFEALGISAINTGFKIC